MSDDESERELLEQAVIEWVPEVKSDGTVYINTVTFMVHKGGRKDPLRLACGRIIRPHFADVTGTTIREDAFFCKSCFKDFSVLNVNEDESSSDMEA